MSMTEDIENSKQIEFLMAIRDVGMKIIFKRAKKDIVMDTFARFEQYIQDRDILYKFVQSIAKLDEQIDKQTCTPDNLLIELGQYTPYIVYEDDERVEDPLYDDDDGWLYE